MVQSRLGRERNLVREWTMSDLLQGRESLDAGEQAMFDRFYQVDVASADLVIPDSMIDWVLDTYTALDPVVQQQVVKVTNLWTLQTSLFNPFRALRPQKEDDSGSMAAEIYGEGPDPFDDPVANTSEDSFGRISGEHCVTAGNLARSDASHGVIVFNEHNPWQVTQDAFLDAVRVAGRWFTRSQQHRPEAVYPLLIWNCLWKSGASINHAHMQMLLTERMHYGEIERQRRAIAEYRQSHGASYFDDLFEVHAAFGLGRDVPGGRLIAPLTPLLSNECLLMADRMSDDFAGSIFQVIRMLHEQHGVTSFNLALVQPPLADVDEDWTDMPVIARVVDRGNPLRKTVDTGALELFAASVISSDPFVLARDFAVFDKAQPVADD